MTGDQPPIDLLAGMVDGAWLDRTVFPPLDWAVEGILPEGLTILAGAPKAGKLEDGLAGVGEDGSGRRGLAVGDEA